MSDLTKQIEAAMTNIVYKAPADLIRSVALRGLSGIEQATPVKTGRARSNWNISSGNPDFTTRPASGTIESPEKPRDQSAAIETAPTDKTLYISNGLPYIQKLNGGSSVQAAAMFVEEAMALAVKNAKNAAKRGSK